MRDKKSNGIWWGNLWLITQLRLCYPGEASSKTRFCVVERATNYPETITLLNMFSLPVLPRIASVFALALALGASARADQYLMKGIFTYSDVSSAISIGDQFTVTFDLNTSDVDANSDIETGVFLDAVSNLTFSLKPGSAGNYGGGVMPGSHFLHLTDNWSGTDLVSFYVTPNFVASGLSFAAAAGNPLLEFNFSLYTNTHDVFSLSLPDGESLGTILPELNLAAYDTADLHLIFGDWSNPKQAIATITSISRVSSVPEGDSAGLTLLLLLVNGSILAFAKKHREKLAA